MKKVFLTISFSLVITLLSACSFIDNQKIIDNDNKHNDNDQGESNNNQSDSNDNVEVLSKVELLLKEMTLKEKIGQLFIIRPDALDSNLSPEQINDTYKYGVTSLNDTMLDTLTNYPVGGIVIFGKNIESPSQLIEFINNIKQTSSIPLFVGVDEEGGLVSRISNTPGFDVEKFNSMQEIGESGDLNKALYVGNTIGTYLKHYGFNLNFAPVADVNTNPDNIVIGNRAFGSDPNLVANMVSAEIDGLHQANVMSCVKHFPGHGDTKGDTHDGFVSIDKTWDELKQNELIPFISGINANSDMIMISHITARNITNTDLPSSLSSVIVNDKLRNELNYNNIIITDSMAMGAITKTYSSSEAALMAITAGVDIILMPEDFYEAYDGIYNAVLNGTISEERINESVLRILTLKEKYGLVK